MRALAEWLIVYRRKPHLDRLSEPVCGDEPRTERLERVSASLPEALSLQHHPVVVPVAEELAGGRRHGDVLRADGL
jgi:hypothetical protein